MVSIILRNLTTIGVHYDHLRRLLRHVTVDTGSGIGLADAPVAVRLTVAIDTLA
jgi:hypothetical protein